MKWPSKAHLLEGLSFTKSIHFHWEVLREEKVSVPVGGLETKRPLHLMFKPQIFLIAYIGHGMEAALIFTSIVFVK